MTTNLDRDLYLVIGTDNYITEQPATDFDTIIRDVRDGQFTSIDRIVSFNTREGWSRDVTEDVARRLRDESDEHPLRRGLRVGRARAWNARRMVNPRPNAGGRVMNGYCTTLRAFYGPQQLTDCPSDGWCAIKVYRDGNEIVIDAGPMSEDDAFNAAGRAHRADMRRHFSALHDKCIRDLLEDV